MPISRLPRDTMGVPIQALSPDPTGVAVASIGAVSARVAIPSGSDVIRIAANKSCYFRLGDSSVTADGNDSLFPGGAEVFRVPADATHIAFIQDGVVTGVATVTRLI